MLRSWASWKVQLSPLWPDVSRLCPVPTWKRDKSMKFYGCPFWPCLRCLLLVSFLFIFGLSLFIRLFLLVFLALLHSFWGRFPHLKRLYCYRSGTLTQKLKPLNPSQGTSASEGSAASEGSRIFFFFSFLPSVRSIGLYDTLQDGNRGCDFFFFSFPGACHRRKQVAQ